LAQRAHCTGGSAAERLRRAAFSCNTILKSAKPAHLPVEQPIKCELSLI